MHVRKRRGVTVCEYSNIFTSSKKPHDDVKRTTEKTVLNESEIFDVRVLYDVDDYPAGKFQSKERN